VGLRFLGRNDSEVVKQKQQAGKLAETEQLKILLRQGLEVVRVPDAVVYIWKEYAVRLEAVRLPR